ncbi:hypothetical protein LOAG_10346 [Loa loa]|uniref:Uncharacterized protein n=1 Tax=Loa loa TaxID=7209 RepID=A0A1S0TQ30_LOALO|nr:hypothetical protein LOAG_10346 [Loa loa]EFO18157.1 hypothetical protein LOAG_10346 [Loa loa]
MREPRTTPKQKNPHSHNHFFDRSQGSIRPLFRLLHNVGGMKILRITTKFISSVVRRITVPRNPNSGYDAREGTSEGNAKAERQEQETGKGRGFKNIRVDEKEEYPSCQQHPCMSR